jgi:signal transduction histidine kinase
VPRLFQRFYRTREAEVERRPGIGLGLYIAKGLIDAHGGRIWAESVPGQLTTFRFTLPVPS